MTTLEVSFFKEKDCVLGTPVCTISNTTVSSGKSTKLTLQEDTTPSIGNFNCSPLTILRRSSSGYFSFWTGLSKGLKVILTSCSVWGGIISFIGDILKAFSLFSSQLISAWAFPALKNFNFCTTHISILSFSNLSFLNANLFNEFCNSNLTMIISAKTLNLKECL